MDVFITHIKPGESQAVMAEIGRLDTAHRIHTQQAGQQIGLSGQPVGTPDK